MTRRPPSAVTPMAKDTGMPEIMVNTNKALTVWSTMTGQTSYRGSGSVPALCERSLPRSSRQMKRISTQIIMTADTGMAA